MAETRYLVVTDRGGAKALTGQSHLSVITTNEAVNINIAGL